MTPEEYKRKRDDIVVCGAQSGMSDSAISTTRALLLIADQLNALVEQNRGTALFQSCLLAALNKIADRM